MAWYALYNWFYPWRKTPYTDWIDWYRHELTKRWFESLSEEEKEKIRQEIEDEKRKKEQSYENAIIILNQILCRLGNSRRYW